MQVTCMSKIEAAPAEEVGEAPAPPGALAWDASAADYDDYFAPRLLPWSDAAIDALIGCELPLPQGPVLVPCCGPGRELLRVADALPGRAVIGVDYSAEMVRIARARCGDREAISLVCADATTLSGAYRGRAAAVLSCFGLQLLPAPDLALAEWAATLAPGGLMSVIFWPAQSESEGPFALLRELLSEEVPPPDASWEGRLREALRGAGATVLRDERAETEMRHEDAAALWRELARSAVLRLLAGHRGEAFLAALGERFLHRLGPGPVRHYPAARLLLARRARV